MEISNEPWYPIIQNQWRLLTKGESLNQTALRPEIYHSWMRSKNYGVTLNRQHSKIVSLESLSHYEHNQELLKSAKPYLHRLYNAVAGNSLLICLADRDGWILDLKGDQRICRLVESMSFVPGSNWSESTMGSSGIGISLATAKPVLVNAVEHYLQICHQLTCAAAPIIGHDGELLGTVNVTTEASEYHPHTFGMTVAAADAINTDIVHKQKYWSLQKAPSDTCSHKKQLTAGYTFDDILGESEAMQKAVKYARRAAHFHGNILIEGESGTGKELFAQAIHNESSRATQNFVAVNSAAIPQELAASEYFGYEEGAFTGARRKGAVGKFVLAHGGTLFLDEIGDMPQNQQAILLRVLEEREIVPVGGQNATKVDIRLIAATNQNLKEKIRNNAFREDLFHRLHGLSLVLPPLRERTEDIPLLAKHFAQRLATFWPVEFSENALEKLKAYHWPGNVRELQNVVNQALFHCNGGSVTAEHIEFMEAASPADTSNQLLSLKNMEIALIKQAMLKFNGDTAEAAKTLGISVATLYRRLKTIESE